MQVKKLTEEQKALLSSLIVDGKSIQHRFIPEPLCKSTGRGHMKSELVQELQAYYDKHGRKK